MPRLLQLCQTIESHQATLAVVGLGYVGLPVAATFAGVGFDVLGIDIKNDRIDKINRGENPIEGYEPGLDELLSATVKAGKLKASTDYSQLKKAEVILVSVETPVEADHKPMYQALRSACHNIGENLREGILVIIESTLAPGTMNGKVCYWLEEASGLKANQGFFLGHCPERVMPGKLLHNIRNVSRICGSNDPSVGEAMISLYRQIVNADLDTADCITAELVKTTENTYRDVNIALANEVAMICESLGGDVWKVRELVNKSPGRLMLFPGTGVGGHCIPKDPWLLIAGLQDDHCARLIPMARRVNDGMPNHIFSLSQKYQEQLGLSLNGEKVSVMGYSYLEDSDDFRNSPSQDLITQLKTAGAAVTAHDPFVPDYATSLEQALANAKIIIFMVGHTLYKDLPDEDWLSLTEQANLIIDGRNCLRNSFKNAARARGQIVHTLGIAPEFQKNQ